MACRNEKFDSFLKRTLDKRVFYQVKLFEPCIILGNGEKYSFRFSFFTNEALYVSENPPKSIIFNLPYSNIFSVQLIHDTAAFLQKEIQENVQHVLITLFDDYSKNQASTDIKQTGSTFKNFVSSLRFTKNTNLRTSVVSDSSFQNKESTSSIYTQKEVNHGHNFSDFLLTSHSNSSSGNLSDSTSKLLTFESWLDNDHYHIDVSETHTIKTNKVHFYILNPDSMFYAMLTAVWKAYVLSSTSLGDPNTNYVILSKPSTQAVSEGLLDELKRDIILSSENYGQVENVYRFFAELNDVIKECFKAKAYYWKDSKLISICKKLLVKYSNSDTLELVKRNDEIECMVMICEVVAEMLKQVESLDSCDATLRTLSSEFYASLVGALLRRPIASDRMLRDAELQTLLRDYVAVSSSVLYEMIVAAERASWKMQNSQILSTENLFSIIDSDINLVNFLERVVSYCVYIWTRVDGFSDSRALASQSSITAETRGSLTASDVVHVYRCFEILYCCFKKCRSQEKIIRDKFKEEFKYYIRPESLDQKVPLIYPASFITRNVISTVAKLVLDSSSNAKQSAVFHVKKAP